MKHGSTSSAGRNTVVLSGAQAILGSQMPMIFIVGGLAGQSLAPSACFATMPISMIVLGSMLAAQPLSAVMQHFGRRTGFFVGTLGGSLGAAVAAWGLATGSFAIFLAGSLLTGIYMSAQGFYRFAAADTASDSFRPRAISFVLAGGLFAAVLGPQLMKLTADASSVPFLGTYIAVIVLNLVGSLLFLGLRIPRPPVPDRDAPQGRSRMALLRTPRIAAAIICAMVSYALMNLVMTSTPLAMVGTGHSPADAADVVGLHVLAMYLPSFFTGHLINRFGAERIIATGLVILGAAGAAALAGVELMHFGLALILLGLGWNFGFIGATTMLAGTHSPAERGRVQGLNDMLVFGFVTIASLSSGGLMNCSGGSASQGWMAVILAMGPFLLLAGGVLVWLRMAQGRPRRARA